MFVSSSAVLIDHIMERDLPSLQNQLESEFSRGFDINSPLPLRSSSQDMKWTLIFYAANSGDISILEYLCSLGADLNIRDSEGRTICHHLIKCHKFSLLRILLRYEVDLDIRDIYNLKAYEYQLIFLSTQMSEEIDDIINQFRLNKIRRKMQFLFVMKYSKLYSNLSNTLKRFILESYFA